MFRTCAEDAKYGAEDASQLWFPDSEQRQAFVDAFESWQRDNPQPRLTCGPRA